MKPKSLRVLSERVARHLLTVERRTVPGAEPSGLPRLTFPRTLPSKSGETKSRVSEQEARFLFCQELERGGVSGAREAYYGVEVPTQDPNAGGGRSAAFDLALFGDAQATERLANVEFKAHNATAEQYRNDFLKLVQAGELGLFFQTLESIDSGTLCRGYEPGSEEPSQLGVLSKYRDAMKAAVDSTGGELKKPILIAVCILRPVGVLLLKTLRPGKASDIDAFFKIGTVDVARKPAKIDFDLEGLNDWTRIYLRGSSR